MRKPFSIDSPLRLAAVLAAAFTLGGCATFSKDGGIGSVEQAAREHLNKEVFWAKTDADHDTLERRVKELLAKPLSVDDAVQIALFNNRGLQASFFELGIAEADVVQAGRLPNPAFSMLRARNGDAFTIEQTLTVNVLSLLTMPTMLAMQRRRFVQSQGSVALEMLTLAAETRKAYYLAVAASESAGYMRQVRQAAEAGAELARRMAQVGNFNKLQQAREHGFYADAILNLARAEQAQLGAREKLTRLLGLWGEQTQFVLPERLPELPASPNELQTIERTAITQRLDVQAAKLETEAMAQNLGLTKATRFINALEFGPARILEGERSDPYRYGFEVRFELPIFDWGTARVAKAESIYMQAVNRAAETAINARSEVRQAYLDYRSAHDIARHYRDEIVPIRKRIADENQLRYNGMLIGVFDLLADARSQITSVNGYIEAQRDFWLAQADLEMAMIGKPSMSRSPKVSIVGSAAAGEH
ncbi:MAG: TolC family protein [Betaproteobacteria bacterium]